MTNLILGESSILSMDDLSAEQIRYLFRLGYKENKYTFFSDLGKERVLIKSGFRGIDDMSQYENEYIWDLSGEVRTR